MVVTRTIRRAAVVASRCRLGDASTPARRAVDRDMSACPDVELLPSSQYSRKPVALIERERKIMADVVLARMCTPTQFSLSAQYVKNLNHDCFLFTPNFLTFHLHKKPVPRSNDDLPLVRTNSNEIVNDGIADPKLSQSSISSTSSSLSTDSTKPHLLTQSDLNDLVRDLGL
ncbi:hypothetical protein EVAR_85972_1 [Eumeta japonica]|uniref:Uncharacterized protein n=1 Tax=Eumeta variegata TaxID=151549 RepID=A0A4C1UJW8_EUMVA|nr:hypothetical protein EVAR_85972_1 [Eumeta japonica]